MTGMSKLNGQAKYITAFIALLFMIAIVSDGYVLQMGSNI